MKEHILIDKRKAIWTLFPESYCENFPETTVNSKLNKDYNWKIELEVMFEDLEEARWVFTVLPSFMGLQFHSNELYFTVTDEDSTTQEFGLLFKPQIGQQFKITVEHSKNRNLKVFINNKLKLILEFENKKISSDEKTYVVLNSLTEDKPDHPDIPKVVLISFLVYVENRLKAKHDFTNFIHDKSVDLTGNLNFLNRIH